MSWFTSIVGTVAKVATTAYGILKAALPIFEAMRPAVKEVEEVFAYIEKRIQDGGTMADDFLDKNLAAVQALEDISGKAVVLFQHVNTLAADLRIYSQEQTPETITEDEAIALGEQLLQVRALIASWNDDLPGAIAKLNSVHD